MKTIFPLLALILVTACDGGGSPGKRLSKKITTPAPQAEKAVENAISLNPLKVGMTSTVESIGNAPGIHLTKYQIYSSPIQTTTKTVILKVEGEYVYKFREVVGLPKTVVSRTVTLEKPAEDLSNLLNHENSTVENDILIYALPQVEKEQSLSNGSRIMIQTLNSGFINLKNYFCDFKAKSLQYVEVILGNAVKDTLSLESSDSSKCSETGLEEVKRIDLSEITFCDKTAPDRDCEIRDMSFLTDN